MEDEANGEIGAEPQRKLKDKVPGWTWRCPASETAPS